MAIYDPSHPKSVERCNCIETFKNTIKAGERTWPYKCTVCGRIFVADSSQMHLAEQLMPAIVVRKAAHGLVVYVPPSTKGVLDVDTVRFLGK
jgi:hypothetical protein